jgi:hypothetical protein
MNNRYHVAAIYNSYGQTYFENENTFLWAGLAKRAGAPIYAGLSDAETGNDLGVDDSPKLQKILMTGMQDVYSDIGWQFVTYHVGGLAALEFSRDRGDILPTNYDAWNAVDTGRRTSNPPLIVKGNKNLLRREQEVVLARTFADLRPLTVLYVSVPWFMSIAAKSPVPGGPDFTDISPGGDITRFADRWPWVAEAAGSMFEYWHTTSQQTRKQWVAQRFFDAADGFDFIGPLVR